MTFHTYDRGRHWNAWDQHDTAADWSALVHAAEAAPPCCHRCDCALDAGSPDNLCGDCWILEQDAADRQAQWDEHDDPADIYIPEDDE